MEKTCDLICSSVTLNILAAGCPTLRGVRRVGTMLMELEGFASDWKFVASFIQFKISCYDQRECPAFENREGWGSQSSYAMQKSRVGQPPTLKPAPPRSPKNIPPEWLTTAP
jgi:hypothetical protein